MERIHLMGSEEVQRAGCQIASAASDMMRAANIISGEIDRLIQSLDYAITRLEAAANDLAGKGG